MKVILTDKTEIIITDREAEQIEKDILKSTEGYIKIGNDLIKKTQVARVTAGGKSQADIFDEAPQLPAGTCRSSHSIQREINMIAKEEGGVNWRKLITDYKWRDSVREKLLAATDDWCDYKTNNCVCN